MPKNHRINLESRIIFAVVVAVLLLAGCETVQPASKPLSVDLATPPPICAQRAVVVDRLEAAYDERPRFRLLGTGGTLVELLTAKSGTWTMIVTTPQGITCLMAVGKHWQDIKPPEGGTPS